jgi:hypothetical protein
MSIIRKPLCRKSDKVLLGSRKQQIDVRAMDIRKFLDTYSLPGLTEHFRPSPPTASMGKAELIRISGAMAGKGDRSVALLLGEKLLEIPIAAIHSIELDESIPSVANNSQIQVHIEVYGPFEGLLYEKVQLAAIAGAGTKPFVLSQPSETKKYSVPAEKFMEIEARRTEAFESKLKEAPGHPAPIAEEKDFFSHKTTHDSKETSGATSPYDTKKVVSGATFDVTDFSTDDQVDIATDYEADTDWVPRPNHNTTTMFDTKSTTLTSKEYDTKSVKDGTARLSTDWLDDFQTDATSDQESDITAD